MDNSEYFSHIIMQYNGVDPSDQQKHNLQGMMRLMKSLTAKEYAT